MRIEIYPEVCCEICNDVIHNHMDCPACNKEFAPTDCYLDIVEWEKEPGFILGCESCKAQFKLISTGEYLDEYEWERL